MTPIYLCIINGPEQRDNIIERTIRLSEPYFDRIMIFQNGISKEPSKLIDKYTVFESQDFIPLKDILIRMVHKVEQEAWILHSDSDEVCTKSTFQWIKNERNKLEDNNLSYVYFNAHRIVDNKYQWRQVDGNFHYVRMYKNTDGIYPAVAQKVHFACSNINPKIYHSKDIRVNHIKHDFAVKLSTLAFMIYAIDKQDVGFDNITDEEIITLNNIKSYFGTEYTPAKTYQQFNNKNLWKEIIKISNNLKTSNVAYVREMYDAMEFIINCDKQLVDLYTVPECEMSCCR